MSERGKITVLGDGPHVEDWLLKELYTLDPRLELHWIAKDGNWVIKYKAKDDGRLWGISTWPADQMDRRLIIALHMWDTHSSEAQKRDLLADMEKKNAKTVAAARQTSWDMRDHSKVAHALRGEANALAGYPVNPGPIFVPQNLVTPIKKKPKNIILPGSS